MSQDFNIYCLQGGLCFGRPRHCELDQTGRSGVNHPEIEAKLDSLADDSSPPPQKKDRACVSTERVRPCLYSGLNRPPPSAQHLSCHSNDSFLCTISSKNARFD